MYLLRGNIELTAQDIIGLSTNAFNVKSDFGLSSELEDITVSKTDDSGMEWKAAGTVSSLASGFVTFSLQVTDRAGNQGVSVTQTTDQSSVEIDTSVPVLQNLLVYLNSFWN